MRPATFGDAHPSLRDNPRFARLMATRLDAPDLARAVAGPDDDPRVRVGLLCPCLFCGGAEAWQLALARYADASRIRWMGCCVVHGEASIAPEMRAATARLMPISAGRAAARDLAGRCDVLVTWAIEDAREIAASAARPPKVVAVCHSPVESPWGVRVYAATKADCFVAVSELALPALPPESRAGAKVIWNAADVDRLVATRSRAEMRAQWGVPADAPVAGYLGRLSAEKDPQAMVRLAAALPEPWRVVVVGAGAERMETGGRLLIVGADPNAGDVLNAFDVLVVPSHYESFGLTLAEGLVAGVPVVSTEVGIAKLVPGITEPVPVGADGPGLAAAVLRAYGPRPGPGLADCGDGVWVGSGAACDSAGHRFDRVIHIHRGDPDGWGVCGHVKRAEPGALALTWLEEGPIESMSPPLAEVLEFAAGPGSLLVHCAAGVTRSTAVSVAAKIARGCDPEKAEGDVRAAMLRDRGRPVHWHQSVVDRFKAEVRPSPASTPRAPTRREAVAAIVPRLMPGRFGREWTDLITCLAAPSLAVDPATRDAVLACPDRGGVLPVSMQDDCGCQGRELSECRAGRGTVAGRVTLAECLACKAG